MSGQADMQKTPSDNTMEAQQSDQPTGVEEEPEGLDTEGASWGDYPIDDLLIPERESNDFRHHPADRSGQLRHESGLPARLHLAGR